MEVGDFVVLRSRGPGSPVMQITMPVLAHPRRDTEAIAFICQWVDMEGDTQAAVFDPTRLYRIETATAREILEAMNG